MKVKRVKTNNKSCSKHWTYIERRKVNSKRKCDSKVRLQILMNVYFWKRKLKKWHYVTNSRYRYLPNAWNELNEMRNDLFSPKKWTHLKFRSNYHCFWFWLSIINGIGFVWGLLVKLSASDLSIFFRKVLSGKTNCTAFGRNTLQKF